MPTTEINAKIAIDDYLRGDKLALDFILNQFKVSENFFSKHPEVLFGFLDAVNQIPEEIASFLYDYFLCSQAWYNIESSLFDCCCSLLIGLGVNYHSCIPRLLKSICNILLVSDVEPLKDIESNRIAQHYSRIAVKAIRELLSVMPHLEEQLVDDLNHSVSFWLRPPREMFFAFSNLLYLCSHPPEPLLMDSSLFNLLDLAFKQLIEIEANANTNLSSFNFPSILSSIPNLLDPASYDENKVKVIARLPMNSSDSSDLQKSELALWAIVMCLRKLFPSREKPSKEEWTRICTIFRCLRTRLYQHVLPVRCNFTAFPLLVAVMCSLRWGLLVNLVENMWNFVKDERNPQESRVRCVTYLVDLLASGPTGGSTEITLELLHDMTAWCVEYTYFRRGQIPTQTGLLVSKHPLFCTVFEAIIYLITFRQSDLLDRAHRETCCSLPVGQLINSPFRLLDTLPPGLKSVFCATVYSYRLNWALGVLEIPELLESSSEPSSTDSTVAAALSPSFDCPLRRAMDVFEIAAQLGLRNFVPVKLFTKSRRYLSAEKNGILTKRLRNDKKHFDCNALTNLHRKINYD